jgi:signal transduction histidine kinase
MFMKKQILVSILLYFFVMVVLIVTLYGFVNEQVEIIIPSLMIMVGSLILGFMLNSYLLREKFRLDDNVLDLTKEILHELTIPISTIQANSLLLKRTLKNDPKSMKRLQRIEDSSSRLEGLYEELLYSIKKEIRTVAKETIDVSLLVKERVDSLKYLNRNPFSVELEPLIIMVDKIGFEKMLDNILVNAMKYSDKNKPIEIQLENYILMVQDHGIGMNEEELKRVYKRYFQSDDTSYGEGIGLALVKAYCGDEKIKLWIESEKNVGTKVYLDLRKILYR